MQSTLVTGDTLNFATSVDGYLASGGWTLKFRLVPRLSGTAITLVSAADGDQHRVQVTAAVTATWAAGVYSWASYVEKASESYSVESGVVTLLPNPRVVGSNLDVRSDAEVALDNVDAAIKGKASSLVLSYRIGERELRSYSMTELLALRAHLMTQVRLEQNAARVAKGLSSTDKIYVRMGRG